MVETLVSLMLFGLTIAAIGPFLVQQTRQAASNVLMTQAYTLAENELEAVRALDYDAMTNRSASKTIGNKTFTINTNVTTNVPSTNMKKVVVRVDWADNSGDRNVSVSTVYTQVRR